MKLSNYFNFSSTVNSMIIAYLTGRSQSDSAHITSEILRGSVLGPLLLCLFMNDISEVIGHCKYHIYADYVHVQLYISGNYDVMGDYVARLNNDLVRFHRWIMSSGLLLNPK
jgi:hypothetical protein